MDFKSALPPHINIVLYLGGAEERHTLNVPARGTYVVFLWAASEANSSCVLVRSIWAQSSMDVMKDGGGV